MEGMGAQMLALEQQAAALQSPASRLVVAPSAGLQLLEDMLQVLLRAR